MAPVPCPTRGFPRRAHLRPVCWIALSPEYETEGGGWYEPPESGRDFLYVVARSGPDRDNLIPLDTTLHDEQHRIGWPAFSKKYGFDRFAVAAGYERRYRAEMSVSPEQGGITG